MPVLVFHFERPPGEALLQVRTIIEEISPPLFRERTRPIAGAEEILKSLHGAGSKLGVVTSSRKRHLDMKMHALEESGTAVLFDAIITADDVQNEETRP